VQVLFGYKDIYHRQKTVLFSYKEFPLNCDCWVCQGFWKVAMEEVEQENNKTVKQENSKRVKE
jgi:hypothetical protein